MLRLSEQKMWPFWLITFAFILILIVSQLIQDGAFMDGMLYVSVSKNLADGIGTFWDPHFCKTYQSSFHEQPPLYFGLLALFYKLFGTSMYVERLFCFTCFSITAIYIHKLWKKIFFYNDQIANFSWLPVLFWATVPICFWAYSNFVEETVMSLFVVIAVYYAFIGLFLEKNIIYNLIIAGVFIFLASLTKGIQGLFPIIAAGVFWLVTKRISFGRMLLYSSILVGIPVLIYAFLLFTDHTIYANFEQYFNKRLLGTFNGKNATTDDRFFLLEQLFFHLLPITCISLIIWFVSKKNNIWSSTKSNKTTIAWLVIIGFAGSLPLMITLEQRTWYLVTSLPFFAIAIAMWAGPNLSVFFNEIDVSAKGYKLFRKISITVFFASAVFTITQIGNTKRDKDMLADVYSFGKIIPQGTIITIPAQMCFDFNFKEYLVRYFYISSDDSNASHYYLICRKNLPDNLVPVKYKRYPIVTKEFDLYVLSQ